MSAAWRWIGRLGYRYALPVWLVVALFAVYSRRGQFLGSWLWTGDWVGGSVILTGPLAAGIAAMAASQQRAVFGEATALAQRRLRWTLVGLGSCLGIFTLLQFVVATEAFAATWVVNHQIDGAALLWSLPQFGVLAGYVAFGWIVGSFFVTALSGAVVSIVSYVMAIFPGPLPSALFEFGAATSNIIGLRPSYSLLAAHLAVSAGIALVALTIVSARRRVSGSQSACALGVLICAAGLYALQTTSSARFVVRHEDYWCIQDQEKVCVPRSGSYAAPQILKVVHGLSSQLDLLGVQRQSGLTMVALRPDGSRPEIGTDQPHYFPMALPREQASLANRLALFVVFDVADCTVKEREASRAMASVQAAAMVLAQRVDGSAPPTDNGYIDAHSLDPDRLNHWLRVVLEAAATCRLRDVPPVP